MREILFRGKRIDNGEWLEGWYQPPVRGIHTDGREESLGASLAFIDYDGFLEDAFIIPETVGQFTGLTANGKKIFEGDILDVMHQGVFECRWDGGNFEFSLSNIKESFGIAYVSPNDIFVIGNIHDNPELLKGGIK